MPPPILCSPSTPSYSLFSFFLRLSISLSFWSSWVLGVAEMQCWVWLGCDGFSWIVNLYGGSWWVFAMIRWVGFAIWYRWVLISVILIDFGGFWISVARFVGWSGWLWVLGVGWLGWFRDMGWLGLFWVLLWFCDSLIWMILWFCGFGCGGFFFFFFLCCCLWLRRRWMDVVVVKWVGGYGGWRR